MNVSLSEALMKLGKNLADLGVVGPVEVRLRKTDFDYAVLNHYQSNIYTQRVSTWTPAGWIDATWDAGLEPRVQMAKVGGSFDADGGEP